MNKRSLSLCCLTLSLLVKLATFYGSSRLASIKRSQGIITSVHIMYVRIMYVTIVASGELRRSG